MIILIIIFINKNKDMFRIDRIDCKVLASKRIYTYKIALKFIISIIYMDIFHYVRETSHTELRNKLNFLI